MNATCIFCQIAQGIAPTERVYADADITAFHDLHPQAPTHILVIPNRHIPSLNAASAEDALLLGRMLLVARQVAAERGVESYRLVLNTGAQAGQSVFHIHLHLLGGRRLTWPPG